MDKQSKSRMNKLADKFRSGATLTASEDAELTALESEFNANVKQSGPVRSVWDLPIAKRCFESDSAK